MTGPRVDIPQTELCALYLAADVGYNAHRIADISPIAAEIRSIEYLNLNMQICNYKGFDKDQR
jgi:hypothetical protein